MMPTNTLGTQVHTAHQDPMQKVNLVLLIPGLPSFPLYHTLPEKIILKNKYHNAKILAECSIDNVMFHPGQCSL